MSEKVPEELKEFVFKDIRSADEFNSVLIKRGGRIDPVEMIDAYRKMKKERDAERWDYALNSYELYYKCFGDRSRYQFDRNDHFLYCQCSGTCRCYIKISADLLTGPKEIVDCAIALDKQKKNEELQSALRKFCSVAYTVGNCCPVMKNKGGSKGVDTGWYKLKKYLDPVKKYDGIEYVFCRKKGRGVINDLSNRVADNMFVMFPEKLYGKEIINRLMLADYYDPEYLKLTKPQDYAKDVKAYIDFLNKITLPIIKRGIRIYCGNNLRIIHLNERGLTGFAEKLIEERKKELGIQ